MPEPSRSGPFTVKAAAVKKEFPDKSPPAKVVNLTVEADDGQVLVAEWFTNASTALPGEGEKIDGTLEHDEKWGWKFKKAGGGGGGFRGGGGPRKEDEAQFLFRQRSIAMQNCVGNAVAALALAAEHGDYKPPTVGDLAGQVETVARKLYSLVEEAASGVIASNTNGGGS
jgi:hypothetical protein